MQRGQRLLSERETSPAKTEPHLPPTDQSIRQLQQQQRLVHFASMPRPPREPLLHEGDPIPHSPQAWGPVSDLKTTPPLRDQGRPQPLDGYHVKQGQLPIIMPTNHRQ